VDDDDLDFSDWPDVLDRDAVIPCLAAFGEVVGEMDDVSITITSDFENQVRAHLEPEWAEVFTQDRGPYGRCMAKTIPKEDGKQVVVFDVHLFLKELPTPEPTFRHEALHVLMNRRGEALFHSRDAISDHQEIYSDLVAMAGVAADEYRVDRAINPTSRDPWPSFGPLCAASHNAIHEAAVAYFYNHQTEVVRDVVMRAFAAMTVQAAYVAAWIDAHDLATPALEDAALHERMLGEPWNDVIDAFRTLPPADMETSREALERIAIEIARRFDEWLEEIGFGLEVLDDGSHYFHVYEHEDWVARGLVDEPEAS
jgi:hypothetical protein